MRNHYRPPRVAFTMKMYLHVPLNFLFLRFFSLSFNCWTFLLVSRARFSSNKYFFPRSTIHTIKGIQYRNTWRIASAFFFRVLLLNIIRLILDGILNRSNAHFYEHSVHFVRNISLKQLHCQPTTKRTSHIITSHFPLWFCQRFSALGSTFMVWLLFSHLQILPNIFHSHCTIQQKLSLLDEWARFFSSHLHCK